MHDESRAGSKFDVRNSLQIVQTKGTNLPFQRRMTQPNPPSRNTEFC
jgi:hypothetical protein